MSVTSRPVSQPGAAEKAVAAPHVPSAVETNFLSRLPLFITMFFSFTMVGFFRTFSDTFHFTTAPAIDFHNGSQVLILVAFFVTLLWIVTAWVGYSMLISRYPYTLDLGRFFFDVARFSLLNFQMSFTFLAGQAAYFQVYIFSIALWHAMMLGWYLSRTRQGAEGVKAKSQKDAVSHGLRAATYLVLGLLYYYGVALRLGQPGAEVLRYVIAAATFAMMTMWNLRRIRELTARAVMAS